MFIVLRRLLIARINSDRFAATERRKQQTIGCYKHFASNEAKIISRILLAGLAGTQLAVISREFNNLKGAQTDLRKTILLEVTGEY
jgi:hypothetical protein